MSDVVGEDYGELVNDACQCGMGSVGGEGYGDLVGVDGEGRGYFSGEFHGDMGGECDVEGKDFCSGADVMGHGDVDDEDCNGEDNDGCGGKGLGDMGGDGFGGEDYDGIGSEGVVMIDERLIIASYLLPVFQVHLCFSK